MIPAGCGGAMPKAMAGCGQTDGFIDVKERQQV